MVYVAAATAMYVLAAANYAMAAATLYSYTAASYRARWEMSESRRLWSQQRSATSSSSVLRCYEA
jgi:hypothetical protein